jgi:Glycine zipper
VNEWGLADAPTSAPAPTTTAMPYPFLLFGAVLGGVAGAVVGGVVGTFMAHPVEGALIGGGVGAVGSGLILALTPSSSGDFM